MQSYDLLAPNASFQTKTKSGDIGKTRPDSLHIIKILFFHKASHFTNTRKPIIKRQLNKILLINPINQIPQGVTNIFTQLQIFKVGPTNCTYIHHFQEKGQEKSHFLGKASS